MFRDAQTFVAKHSRTNAVNTPSTVNMKMNTHDVSDLLICIGSA